MSILTETFCIYCQEEFHQPGKLHNHILKKHPQSYAYYSLKEARANQNPNQNRKH